MPKQHNELMTKSGDFKNSKKVLLGPCALNFSGINTGAWRIVRPEVDQEQCALCGTCRKYCPTDAVEVVKDGIPKGVFFNFDFCKGCGICANVCPKKCIAMVTERGE